VKRTAEPKPQHSVVRFADYLTLGARIPSIEVLGYFHPVRSADGRKEPQGAKPSYL
jgi:hypothetical protein